jgi:hypothetical protein
LTPEIAKKHILKCLRHCNKFIAADHELSGSIQAKSTQLTEEQLLVLEDDSTENTRLEDHSDVHFGDINTFDDESDCRRVKRDVILDVKWLNFPPF